MKDRYKNIASWYDKIFEPLDRKLRRIGMKMYPAKAGMNVLDIGCGTGSQLKLYQDEKCHVFGVDLSPAMLNVARAKLNDSADLQLCDASKTSFLDNQFDLIISFTVFHEMAPQVRIDVLNEAKRILKNEGRILLIDFHPGRIQNLKGLFSKLLITMAEISAGCENYKNYRNFMRHGGMPYLIHTTGFVIETEKIVGGNFGIFLLKLA